MLIYNIKKITISLILSCFCSIVCLASAGNPLDSIPPYDGLRVHLTNVELIKVKKERAKIKYDIVNTGRLPIDSKGAKSLSKSVVIEFEDALKNCQCQLTDFQDAIRYQFYYQKLNLPIGKTVKNKYMEFKITNTAPPAMVMYKPRKQHSSFKNPTSEKVKEKLPEADFEQIASAKSNKKESEKKISTEEDNSTFVKSTVEENIPVQEHKKANGKKEKRKKKKEEHSPAPVEIAIETNKGQEEIVVENPLENQKDNTLLDKIEEDAFSEPIVEATPVKEEINPESTRTITKAVTKASANRMIEPVVDKTESEKEDPVKDLAEAVKEENIEILSEDNSTTKLKKKLCSDLVLSDVKIIKQNNSTATIEYTLKNYGEASAKISSAATETGQIFAIKAFLSRSGQLTRGALPIGGGFVKKVPDNKEGLLMPGATYTGILKLDIRKKTRFTPNIILSVDPYLSITECDRSNNTGFINLDKEK